MKIEMGESLMYSWLRHVKGCQVAQLNWKASALEEESWRRLEPFYALLRERFHLSTKKVNSLLKQAEVDVLGIKVKDGQYDLYAIDIAFHEHYLQYQDNIGNITKKMVRSALILAAQFGVKKGEIIFASPRVKEVDVKDLHDRLNAINESFAANGYDFTFRLYFNEDFKEVFIKEVLKRYKDIKDTSDLFVRSVKMLGLFGAVIDDFEIKPESTSEEEEEIVEVEDIEKKIVTPSTVNLSSYSEILQQSISIGKKAQMFFKKLASDGKLSTVYDNSSTTLRGFELLREVKANDNVIEVRKVGDYPRYYSKPYSDNGRAFVLCSQWYEENINILEELIRRFGLD